MDASTRPAYKLDVGRAWETWHDERRIEIPTLWVENKGWSLSYSDGIAIASRRFGLPSATETNSGEYTLILMTFALREMLSHVLPDETNPMVSQIIDEVMETCEIGVHTLAADLGLRKTLRPRDVDGWDDHRLTFDGVDRLLRKALEREIGTRLLKQTYEPARKARPRNEDRQRGRDHTPARLERLQKGGPGRLGL